MVKVNFTHCSGKTLFKILNDNRNFELTTDDALRISNNEGKDAVWAWIAEGLKLTKHEEENISKRIFIHPAPQRWMYQNRSNRYRSLSPL